MITDNNFVRSGRERIADDNYQTVDPRCVEALVGTFPNVFYTSTVVDVCSPNGSGIVDFLVSAGWDAEGVGDAFADTIPTCGWIVSNPPYSRNIVDKIIYRQLERINEGTVHSVAMLLRTSFDHAKTRWNMFGGNSRYAGQIKMMFRPKWFLDTDVTPIHNYVWHIWSINLFVKKDGYQVWYW